MADIESECGVAFRHCAWIPTIAMTIRPVPTLFGLETEYAVSALDALGEPVQPETLARYLLKRAMTRPYLPGNESGVFLENGGRFYIDAGHHPEYAAPETTDPWEAVRFHLAGDRFVATLADELAATNPTITGLTVRKGNIDYVTKATWGSHENYLHSRSPDQLHPALIPHLVTRMVLTGGGGLDPFDSTHTTFVVSPRALYVHRLIALSAPAQLALVDARNQPHGRGYFRQHLMCGDANLSHCSTLLRIGTTALVVALADAGYSCDEAAIAEPLEALRIVARDTSLRRRVTLACGRRATAIEIQGRIVRFARAHLTMLPDWAGAICDLWQEMLERLTVGPEAVADRLDWTTKRAIHKRHARARKAFAGSAGAVAGADPGPASRHHAELCEIEMRYGQLYPVGLFGELDRAGVLRHRLLDADDIGNAISEPPRIGRASVRGHTVRQLAPIGHLVSCGWDQVEDALSGRRLDLSDPFLSSESQPDWSVEDLRTEALLLRLARVIQASASAVTERAILDLAARLSVSGDAANPDRSGGHAIALNNHALDLRSAGRLTEAECLLRAALAIDLTVRPTNHPKVPHRRQNLATVLLMLGRTDEARFEVTEAWRQSDGRYDLTTARILTVRLLIALHDGESAGCFLGLLKSHIAIHPLPNAAEADRVWKLGPVLAALESTIGPSAYELLQNIVRVLNGNGTAHQLESLPMWSSIPAVPLGTPWPRSASEIGG